MQTAVYRNPTATVCVIPYDSFPSTRHKISGIRYLINRMLGYPISNNKKEEEGNFIQTIQTININMIL
jgi:hypothetical protein